MPLNLGHNLVIGKKTFMQDEQLNNLSKNRVKSQGIREKNKTRAMTQKRKRAANETATRNGIDQEVNRVKDIRSEDEFSETMMQNVGSKSEEKRKSTSVECVKNDKGNATTILQSLKESNTKNDNEDLSNAKKRKDTDRGIYYAKY